MLVIRIDLVGVAELFGLDVGHDVDGVQVALATEPDLVREGPLGDPSLIAEVLAERPDASLRSIACTSSVGSRFSSAMPIALVPAQTSSTRSPGLMSTVSIASIRPV